MDSSLASILESRSDKITRALGQYYGFVVPFEDDQKLPHQILCSISLFPTLNLLRTLFTLFGL